MLHINPSYSVEKVNEYFHIKECNFQLQKSFIKEMKVFPHLETKVRIASLTLKNPKYSFDLSEFTSLTSLSLNIKKHLRVNDFIRNKYYHFERVYVMMEGFVDINFINHIDQFNIRKVIIEFDKQEILESVIKNKKLLKRITFCYKECYCTISNDGIIHNKRLTDGFDVTEKGFNNDTILQYYPEHIKINGFINKKIEMDFSSFTFIKSIKSTTSSICFNPPTPLTHLDSKYFYEISSLKELHLQ
ncbi:hypothetical protein CL6EHI_177020 [Entamoeba histolytica]|uniref:Uncharacterized protein n=2 Tax=Entamoeba histolytica TaxID=5759 RepID=C4LY27_ENTH1|nr:hypothetical protein EHI_177020 [Entamoeba histolytica HM-1:IMSS]EAL47413.1 hypothetical protein EHI_177020 [Entamoeba histolytica HM-1:IMSS]GAT93679.1 hypothetical protein CL6EHI_177020 [Entamoeba histolytica]|eukprot:XP_652800.1 hypothetical protein EHI_177020 [Entamoeba histolytica HM-1:IMSS]